MKVHCAVITKLAQLVFWEGEISSACPSAHCSWTNDPSPIDRIS